MDKIDVFSNYIFGRDLNLCVQLLHSNHRLVKVNAWHLPNVLAPTECPRWEGAD